MKLTITITVTDGPDSLQVESEPDTGPTGCESLVEHGNHDSTPRLLGFTAEPLQEDNE